MKQVPELLDTWEKVFVATMLDFWEYRLGDHRYPADWL